MVINVTILRDEKEQINDENTQIGRDIAESKAKALALVKQVKEAKALLVNE